MSRQVRSSCFAGSCRPALVFRQVYCTCASPPPHSARKPTCASPQDRRCHRGSVAHTSGPCARPLTPSFPDVAFRSVRATGLEVCPQIHCVSCEGARLTVPSPLVGEGTMWRCSAQAGVNGDCVTQSCFTP